MILAIRNGIERQNPVYSQGMQKRFVTNWFALSKNGKQRHSLIPQRISTSHVTLPAWKILLGYICSSSTSSDSLESSTLLWGLAFTPNPAISMVTWTLILYDDLISSYFTSLENADEFFRPKQMAMQAEELIKQVKKPTRKEVLTPNCSKVQGVAKTFAIQPNSGRIKTIPAYFPIHDEAMLP